ncbi:unknown [Bacteroides sp. CAG:714]|nr:unknown [Bacteroides sp. CAG:714]
MHQNMSTFSCIRPFVFMRMPGRFPAVNSSTLYSASARKQKSPDSVMNQSFKRCVRDSNP